MSMFPKSIPHRFWQRDEECARIIRVWSLNDFANHMMINKDWIIAGEGLYGRALVKGNLCWKVSHDAVKANDDGYIAYAIAIVRDMIPHSIYAPRIKLIILADDGSYAVLMERLAITLNDLEHTDGNWKSWNAINNTRLAVKYDREDDQELGEMIYPLFKFLRFIKSALGHSWALDLNSGNIMMRHNGQIVVSDPFAWVIMGDTPLQRLLAESM